MSGRRKYASRILPMADGMEVHVTAMVPMDPASYVGFSKAQVHALFDGIAQVVAAASSGSHPFGVQPPPQVDENPK